MATELTKCTNGHTTAALFPEESFENPENPARTVFVCSDWVKIAKEYRHNSFISKTLFKLISESAVNVHSSQQITDPLVQVLTLISG
jgi:hypothetical protein